MAFVKDKIRALNIRLTDLSEYLSISRPTTYKYLDLYEQGAKKQIPGDVLNLFNFINKPQVTSKEQVFTYIITNLKSEDRETDVGKIKRFLNEAADGDPCVEMISIILNGSMDSLLPYIIECQKILTTDNLDDNDIRQISKFVIFKNSVVTNATVTEEEVKLTKQILRGKYHGKE